MDKWTAMHNRAAAAARMALTKARQGQMENSDSLVLFKTGSGSRYLVEPDAHLITGGILGSDIVEFNEIRLSPSQKNPYDLWSHDALDNISFKEFGMEDRDMHMHVCLNDIDKDIPNGPRGNTFHSFSTSHVVDAQKGLTWQQYLDMSAGLDGKYKAQVPTPQQPESQEAASASSASVSEREENDGLEL